MEPGKAGPFAFGNGLFETTSYNGKGQPSVIGLGTSTTDTSIFRLDYTYGISADPSHNIQADPTQDNGNIATETITIGYGQQNPAIMAQAFTYDAVNRLATATETTGGAANWSQTYGYDAYGNRCVSANQGVPMNTQLTPQDLTTNSIDATTNRISMNGFQYDQSGNLKQDGSGATFTYDAENHQKTCVNTNGTSNYTYDGDRRRVQKQAEGVTTVFVYDVTGKLVAEYSSSQPSGSGVSYITADHLGSTRIVTNSLGSQAGGVTARHDYLPFGEIDSAVGPRSGSAGYGGDDDTTQRFTSKERDTESSLDYFLARYYSSPQGRFTSGDPFSPVVEKQNDSNLSRGQAMFDAYLRTPQQWNRYPYATNNPLKYAYPSGQRIEIFGTEAERLAAFNRIQAIVGSEGTNLLYVKEESGHYYVETRDFVKLTRTGELGFRIAALIVNKATVEFHIARTFQLKVSEWFGLVNKVINQSVNAYGGAATISASESTTGNTSIFVAPNAAEIAGDKLDNMLGASKMSDGKPPEFTNYIVDAHEFGHAWANVILKLPTNSDESLIYARKFENAARAQHGMKAFRVRE